MHQRTSWKLALGWVLLSTHLAQPFTTTTHFIFQGMENALLSLWLGMLQMAN